VITYDTSPDRYRYWALTVDAPIARVTLIVHEHHEPGLRSLECLHIELFDIVQRLRFEHPEIGAVVVTGGTEEAFQVALGMPIQDESASTAAVDVVRFANEVHSAIEDASANSAQHWLAALNGSASGPGYELALATDEILLVDDDESTVALPEVPLGLAPSAGGVARLVDKRRVRPDLADIFRTRAEGIGGEQAQRWGLVDRVVPRHRFAEVVGEHAVAGAGTSVRASVSEGVELSPLRREDFEGGFAYPDLRVELDGEAAAAFLTLVAPQRLECFAPKPGPTRLRSRWWPLAVCRQLDDALLLIRRNRPELRTLVLRSEGDALAVAAADVAMTTGYDDDWFVKEVVLYWRRTLTRLEHTAHFVLALIEPDSCFVGTLFELVLAADRAYMFDGTDPDRPDLPPANIFLTGMNFGLLPRSTGLTGLQTRFPARHVGHDAIASRVGDPILATEAAELGLVTAAMGHGEWERGTRRIIEDQARGRHRHDLLGRGDS
jgi:benzoyl-CoA-dihydrodiol lyase